MSEWYFASLFHGNYFWLLTLLSNKCLFCANKIKKYSSKLWVSIKQAECWEILPIKVVFKWKITILQIGKELKISFHCIQVPESAFSVLKMCRGFKFRERLIASRRPAASWPKLRFVSSESADTATENSPSSQKQQTKNVDAAMDYILSLFDN